MNTGDRTANLAFNPASYKQIRSHTQLPCIDPISQLVNFTGCSRQAGTRDIIDWPESSRDQYQMTNITTVINAYTVQSLRALAMLAEHVGLNQTEASVSLSLSLAVLDLL